MGLNSTSMVVDKQELDQVKKLLFDGLQITYETYANCGIHSEKCGKCFDALINSFSAFRNLCNQFEDDLEMERNVISFESRQWFEFILYSQKYFNEATIEVSRMIHASEKQDLIQILIHWSSSRYDLGVLAQGVNSKLGERISLVAAHCCEFSHALMESSIKHDAATFSIAKIISEPYEAKGYLFLKTFKESLASGKLDPNSSFATLIQARSAFDKYHQSLKIQKHVGEEKRFTDKTECSPEDEQTEDLQAALCKLEELILTQKSLEARLTSVQREIHVQTRALQHEQRCEEILNHVSSHRLDLCFEENIHSQDMELNVRSNANLATQIAKFVSDSSASVHGELYKIIIKSLRKEFESVTSLVSDELALMQSINVNADCFKLDSKVKESFSSFCMEDWVTSARQQNELFEICQYLSILLQDCKDLRPNSDELAKLVETYLHDLNAQRNRINQQFSLVPSYRNSPKVVKGMQKKCWIVGLLQDQENSATFHDCISYILDVDKAMQKAVHIKHNGDVLKDLFYTPTSMLDSQAPSNSLLTLHGLGLSDPEIMQINASCVFEVETDPSAMAESSSRDKENDSDPLTIPFRQMLTQVEEFRPDLILAVYDLQSIESFDAMEMRQEYSREDYRRFYLHCCKLQETARRLCNDKIIYISSPVAASETYELANSLKMVRTLRCIMGACLGCEGADEDLLPWPVMSDEVAAMDVDQSLDSSDEVEESETSGLRGQHDMEASANISNEPSISVASSESDEVDEELQADEEDTEPHEGSSADNEYIPSSSKKSERPATKKKADSRAPSRFWRPPPTDNEPVFQAAGMLLDLADRIPYNSVKEPKASVWENFRVTTEACNSARAVAEKLLWFSEQLVPRIIKKGWTEGGEEACQKEKWEEFCRNCSQREEIVNALRQFERLAIDWDEVSAAFREEWQSQRSKKSSSKGKRKALSQREEVALAATTQLGNYVTDEASEVDTVKVEKRVAPLIFGVDGEVLGLAEHEGKS
ncbi:hypothetical protein GUITHDRAFT_112180 [Guillardia theta CCMP2712]|uniref:Uncharacterized protein n=1 Tax=Guillardia theta (strain CCMP2712) TaxID=905079 RepID=L1IZS7_GUITC|nr:hypothetical protein GUITHDRAFT_112180 [Guillardia theta CCMP2712]EKX41763.1 hypothetical protein GUITHDRAFT_112180 [Guillardia theta CCMP2712]|eukprot:XP_005828743.1 hypothetical protein GUITHDRAFT_112180 [Guillardia theta CCMP2712]